MRKISELLPIVRRYLWDGKTAWVDDRESGLRYVCFASSDAVHAEAITADEGEKLDHALFKRMFEQYRSTYRCGPPAYLIDLLRVQGVVSESCRVSEVAYVPHRDKWLDDWQAELVAKGE